MTRHVTALLYVTLLTSAVALKATLNIQDAVLNAFGVAKMKVDAQKALNEQLFRSGVDTGSGSSDHLRMLNRFASFKKSRQPEADNSAILLKATRELRNTFVNDFDAILTRPDLSSLWAALSEPYCTPRQPQCGPSKYRTTDGSCNNLEHPTWGMANRAQKRYLQPAYADGIGTPRMYGVTGAPLPSARHVSNVIHRPAKPNALEPTDSIMVMQWGQLLDHDIVDTPTVKGFDGAAITCCNLPDHLKGTREACFPIEILADDPYFKNKNCMNFVRSVTSNPDACVPGSREQLNEASSFMDAGFLYGADEEMSISLRAYSRGLMLTNGNGFFYPHTDQGTCMRQHKGDFCMNSGDDRMHVYPGLASAETLMLREHNRIAGLLGTINPHWDDERIYQETRKIVIAQNQQITYGEYLPRIIGPTSMKSLGLYLKPKGFNTVYRPEVDATMANGFAGAAFRFGHSQIMGNVNMFYKNGSRQIYGLEQTFNRPHLNLVDQGRGTDRICRWMFNEPSVRSDRFLEPAVRDRLFLDKDGNSFDLAALNIQRGRDHGLPPYNAWRRWCGLPVSDQFFNMPDLDPETIHGLSKIYSHPDDVDIFTGGIAERHVVGGKVGPTFSCIIGRQFKELKYGDRFWYENDFPNTGFTLNQLSSIKTQRFSNIMCNNQHDEVVTEDLLSIPSFRNPLVPCNSLPQINLWLWQEHPQQNGSVRSPRSVMSKYGFY